MEKLKIILTIGIFANLIGCEPMVTFSEPQPAGKDNLSKFPGRLQGEYVSLDDNSVLVIDDKIIRRAYDYVEKIHSSQLGPGEKIVGDTLIDLVTQEKAVVKREGDSLVIHNRYTDTLFKVDSDNVVRKFKGYYFLNSRGRNEGWEVHKIQLSKGQLVVSGISKKGDIDKLREITETDREAAAPYKIKATKKQFKKFIKSEGFSDSEVFVKK